MVVTKRCCAKSQSPTAQYLALRFFAQAAPGIFRRIPIIVKLKWNLPNLDGIIGAARDFEDILTPAVECMGHGLLHLLWRGIVRIKDCRTVFEVVAYYNFGMGVSVQVHQQSCVCIPPMPCLRQNLDRPIASLFTESNHGISQKCHGWPAPVIDQNIGVSVLIQISANDSHRRGWETLTSGCMTNGL